MADLFGHEKPASSHALLAVYEAEFQRRFKTPAPIVWRKDAPNAARLLRRYSLQQLSAWVPLYFDVPDQFIQQGGFTFGIFTSCIAKVMQYARRIEAAQAHRVVQQPPSANFLEIQRQVRGEWGSR